MLTETDIRGMGVFQLGWIISLTPTLGAYSNWAGIMIKQMEVNRNKTKSNQTKLQTKLNSAIVHFRIYYKRISVALIFIFNMKKEESRVKG